MAEDYFLINLVSKLVMIVIKKTADDLLVQISSGDRTPPVQGNT